MVSGRFDTKPFRYKSKSSRYTLNLVGMLHASDVVISTNAKRVF